jgi:single-stranded DNA-specific DHH superfamily exonuclease
MAILENELGAIRATLNNAHRPIIFFDDDCDGLSSFLQVYKFVEEGKGVPVKDSPGVEEHYVKMVDDYQPDLIVVLDKPYIDDAFVRQVSSNILWVDHHEPQEAKGEIDYYNPRLHDDADNRPTSYWLHRALDQSLWVAMFGIIGDWHYPDDLADSFREAYPGLLSDDVSSPEAAMHDSRIGTLVRVMNFNLKGTVKETMESVKTLTRIDAPEEILEQTTSRGSFIWKKYEQLAERYQQLLDHVVVPDDKLLVYKYEDEDSSFTGDLSNELLYRHPEKVIIVARRDKGMYKCSLRSSDVDIASILDTCLQNIDGGGGGHKHACGAGINVKDFDTFIECFKSKI